MPSSRILSKFEHLQAPEAAALLPHYSELFGSSMFIRRLWIQFMRCNPCDLFATMRSACNIVFHWIRWRSQMSSRILAYMRRIKSRLVATVTRDKWNAWRKENERKRQCIGFQCLKLPSSQQDIPVLCEGQLLWHKLYFPCVRLVSCMHSGFTLYVRYLPCMQSRIGTPDICLVPGISVFNHSLHRLSVYLGAIRPAIEGAIESAISLSLAAIATDASQSDFGGSIFTWIQCIVVRLKLCFYLTTASLLGWTKSALWKYQHSESITVKLLKFNEIERFLWFLWILLIYEVFIFISFLLKFRHIGFILLGISPWKPVDSIESTVYNVDPHWWFAILLDCIFRFPRSDDGL